MALFKLIVVWSVLAVSGWAGYSALDYYPIADAVQKPLGILLYAVLFLCFWFGTGWAVGWTRVSQTNSEG